MKKHVVFRIIKILIIILIIAAVIMGVLYYMYAQQLSAVQSSVQMFRTASASNGDIELSVTGTGAISPQQTTDIVIDWSGTVKEVNYEVGDLVEEGAIIGRVVNETISSDIEAATNSLRQQEINLEKQKDSLNKNITAPEAGRIKMLKAMQGDDLSAIGAAFGQICYISPDGMFTMTFTHTYVGEMKKDALLQVRDSDGLSIKAIVTEVVEKKVTIDILDDIMLEEGEYVKVYRWEDEDTVIGDGYVSIKNAIKITGSGKATGVMVMENDIVARGQEMFTIDTTDAQLSFESQTISVSDAQRKISDLRKDIGKNDIPAPTSGVISALNLTQHSNCSSGAKIATIMSVDRLETVVSVDELDIAKVAVGQKATITLDALEGQTFTGVVTEIAVMGETANGFATFPVTVAIDDPGVIKIGMSCEVEIIVDEAKSVMMLPVEVLSQDARGYYVQKVVTYEPNINAQEQTPLQSFLSGLFGGNSAGGSNVRLVTSTIPADAASGADGSAGMPGAEGARGARTPGGGQMPEGAAGAGDAIAGLAQMGVVSGMDIVTEIVRLEVGIVNENYAEILSGLTADDVIVYASDSGNSMMQMMMMMGGGGGGAMPAGGGTRQGQGGSGGAQPPRNGG